MCCNQMKENTVLFTGNVEKPFPNPLIHTGVVFKLLKEGFAFKMNVLFRQDT